MISLFSFTLYCISMMFSKADGTPTWTVSAILFHGMVSLNAYLNSCWTIFAKTLPDKITTLSTRITFLPFGSIFYILDVKVNVSELYLWFFFIMPLSKSLLHSETENKVFSRQVARKPLGTKWLGIFNNHENWKSYIQQLGNQAKNFHYQHLR